MFDDSEICLRKGTILKKRYEVISVLRMGGFGITCQAVDQLLNCYAAVKEFKIAMVQI